MFKDRLRTLRRSRNLSQENLAKIFNITQRSLSRLETGESAPTEDIINKAADFFGVSSDYMLGRTNIKNIYNYIKKWCYLIWLYLYSIIFYLTFFTFSFIIELKLNKKSLQL